ncbi:hypothetical protein J5N97_013394 [Dioscorea zingiberensis]|uniref:ERAP1-like C-terminal domain-containing protein n=1 Tax=Dioscorea zingiberensis TaxID=325984 RepID=A0A9D5CT88_9LILI|nr:hypothetical protein J5N97_013394 [Dioscorea zingiberensis]
MLRGEILTDLAELGHEITINEVVRHFTAFLDDKHTPLLPPATRKAAYVIAMMQTINASNKLGYESLLRVYQETDLTQEKVCILDSLACCHDSVVVLDVLNVLLTSMFSSGKKANEIEAFFASRIKPSISRTLKQSLERVKNNARWIQRIKKDKDLGEIVRELAYRKY